jgi:hypothetical protein
MMNDKLTHSIIERDIKYHAYNLKLTNSLDDPHLKSNIDYNIGTDKEALQILYKDKYIRYNLTEGWNEQYLDYISDNIIIPAVKQLCFAINPCHAMLWSSNRSTEYLLQQILKKL